jgi:ribosomal protein S18 acetylase RimI-like enzyme
VSVRYAHGCDVDLSALTALFDAVGWHHRTREPDRLARMVRGSTLGVTAHDGDALVGFARAISDDAFNAYISTVAVLPAYQRRGIGTELVRRLVDGREDLTWVLNTPDVPAFYAKLGFVPTATMMTIRRTR